MNNYDEYMDITCTELCDALNNLPEVKTFESCCGHLKSKYCVWLKTNNTYSMAVIARAFDKRYACTEMLWTTTIETIDIDFNPQFCIGIYSNKPFDNYELMKSDIKTMCNNLKYWSSPEFYKHFKYGNI